MKKKRKPIIIGKDRMILFVDKDYLDARKKFNTSASQIVLERYIRF